MKILALPVDKGGCGSYRVRQPLAMIQEYTEHETYVAPKDPDDDESMAIAEALPLVDVFVCRQGNLISETKARFESIIGKEIKGKWVIDIDDNMGLISPYSEHYRESGVEEYYDKNLNKWIWQDGVNGFDLGRNRKKLENAVRSLAEADMVTVTTEKLAEYASQFNKRVRVLPNCINFGRWWKLPTKKNKRLRFGWSGGVSHYEDWYVIKEPLNRLMREQKFTLVVAGDYFKGIIDKDNQKYVEVHPWVDFTGHSYRMMCMNLDWAIIPLADLPFNQYKSAVKWFEMSAMKVPSIVADVGPYREEIRGNDLCLRYSDAISFEKAVFSCSKRTSEASRLGINAYNWTFKHRNAKTSVELWVKAYEELVYG